MSGDDELVENLPKGIILDLRSQVTTLKHATAQFYGREFSVPEIIESISDTIQIRTDAKIRSVNFVDELCNDIAEAYDLYNSDGVDQNLLNFSGGLVNFCEALIAQFDERGIYLDGYFPYRFKEVNFDNTITFLREDLFDE